MVVNTIIKKLLKLSKEVYAKQERTVVIFYSITTTAIAKPPSWAIDREEFLI